MKNQNQMFTATNRSPEDEAMTKDALEHATDEHEAVVSRKDVSPAEAMRAERIRDLAVAADAGKLVMRVSESQDPQAFREAAVAEQVTTEMPAVQLEAPANVTGNVEAAPDQSRIAA